MDPHRRALSLREIKTVLRRTDKEIKRQEREQRWNYMQTKDIMSKLARQISHEGISSERPNIHSSLQDIGIEQGTDAPTKQIFETVDAHLSKQINHIKSKENRDKVYQEEASKHINKIAERKIEKRKKEREKWLTAWEAKNPKNPEGPKRKSQGCVPGGICTIQGGKKSTKTNKKRKTRRKTRRKMRRKTRRNY